MGYSSKASMDFSFTSNSLNECENTSSLITSVVPRDHSQPEINPFIYINKLDNAKKKTE